jgi:FixJ family two-component response regulator
MLPETSSQSNSNPSVFGFDQSSGHASPDLSVLGDLSDGPLIAVIDDDEPTRYTTLRTIRAFGFRAESFPSAWRFLDSRRSEGVACLVLDMRMPEISGLDLQDHLSRANKRIPIVFITAHATQDEEQKALARGAVALLRKPVTGQVLIGAIETALRRSQA